MNQLLEIVFNRRGYTREYIDHIDTNKPGQLKDMDLMVDHLHRIYESGDHIVVIPDFDMDGVMSGVIGFAGLVELGFNTSLYIPDATEGYGFDAKTIDQILEQYPNAKAVITCDVGITCESGVRRAKERGLTVLITDHHREDPNIDVRSIADAIVDPMRLDEDYPNPAICGAYVLWKVLHNYVSFYGYPHQIEQIHRLRVFAGIGTVSDMMPVLYENRQLVRDAISICQLVYSDGEDRFVNNLYGTPTYVNAFRGLYEIMSIFGKEGKIRDSSDVDEGFFGFYLAPVFNSVRRLDEDLDTAFGVFFAPNPEIRAKMLYALNLRRKELVAQHFEQIMASYNKYNPYIYESDASSGILGLLATKLLKPSSGPSLVVRQDGTRYRGSGRSPSWYPAMSRLRDAGFYAAGHDSAFGVGVEDDAELSKLYDFLIHDVESVRNSIPASDLVESAYDYHLSTVDDGDVPFDIPLFYEFVAEVRRLKPFGREFEEPRGRLTFDPSNGTWQTMGKERQHLKVTLAGGFEVIAWNQAKHMDALQTQSALTIDGKLGRNEFNGRTSINFIGSFDVGD